MTLRLTLNPTLFCLADLGGGDWQENIDTWFAARVTSAPGWTWGSAVGTTKDPLLGTKVGYACVDGQYGDPDPATFPSLMANWSDNCVNVVAITVVASCTQAQNQQDADTNTKSLADKAADALTAFEAWLQSLGTTVVLVLVVAVVAFVVFQTKAWRYLPVAPKRRR